MDFGDAIPCYEMILVHSLDIVLGTRKKLSQGSIVNIKLGTVHTRLLKFKHMRHFSGNHGNYSN